MTPERWKRVNELFERALECEPERRAAFLAEACGDDPELRQEVESLLLAHEGAGTFIDAPAVRFGPRLDPGARLGPYEVLDFLESGGMGEVYRARDSRLGRTVAVKVLSGASPGDPERRRRFEQEARAASALSHPNILTVFDVGTTGEIDYVVSELLEGETLRARLAGGALPRRECLDCAVQIVSGLVAAHERGIVHRDLKPANLFLTREGRVKILDFGLAKQVRPPRTGTQPASATASLQTRPGVLLGTVAYMSPEQARGLEVDARTDIWSCGVVLYEMITGHDPFQAATGSDVIASILDRQPPPLTTYTPDAPAELQWIVSKALRKDVEERYQTARELLSDLKDVGQGQGKATEPQKRRRAPAIALAIGALALGAAAYRWLQVPARIEDAPAGPTSATFTQLTDQPGPELFPSLSPDGRSLVYVSAAQGNGDIYLQRVGGRNPVNLTADSPAADTQPAFSPEGARLAFRSERENGGIFLMGATGESVKRVSDVGYNPAWSPDGRSLVVASESVTQPSSRPTRSQLWIIDVATGAKRSIGDADALQPRWSPHGQRIAYWGRPKGGVQGDIWTLPAGGGEAVPVGADPAMDWNPEWSPDGRHLYFSSDRGGTMNIWRVAVDEATGAAQGLPQAVTVGAATSNQHLSISQDGRHLAYVAQEDVRNLRKVAFDPATEKAVGEPVAITRGSMRVGFPDPSPDGEWVAFHSMGTQADIFLVRRDGTGLRQLTDDRYRDQWPRWSPDGKRIAFSSYRGGGSEVWVIDRDGSGLQQLTQQPGAHYNTWSPDGSRLAYATHRPRGGAFVFDLETRRVLLSLDQPADPSKADEPWSWSPDGKRLAMLRHLADGVHGGVGVYDLESRTYDWLNDYGDFPVWLADGRRMLFVHKGKILLVDRVSRRQREVLTSGGEEVGSPALSRDNRTLYFTYVATEGDVWLMTLR